MELWQVWVCNSVHTGSINVKPTWRCVSLHPASAFSFSERSGSLSAHSSRTHSCTLTFPQRPFENLVSWYVSKHLPTVARAQGSCPSQTHWAWQGRPRVTIREQRMFVRHSRSTQRRVSPVFVLLLCSSSGFTLTHRLKYSKAIDALWTVCFTLAGEWETQCDEDFVLRILWAHLHLNMLTHEQLRRPRLRAAPHHPACPFRLFASCCASKSRTK